MSKNLEVGTMVKIVTKNSPNYGRLECITEVDTSRSNRHWYFIKATRSWYPDNELEVYATPSWTPTVGVSDEPIINVGDKVLVTKPANPKEYPGWNSQMDCLLGTPQTIIELWVKGSFKVKDPTGKVWYLDKKWLTKVDDNKSSPSGWNHGTFPEVNDIVIVNNSGSKHHNRTFTVVEVDRERQGKKPNHFYKLSNNCWYSLEELIPATGMVIKTVDRVAPLDNPVVSNVDDVEDGDWEDEDNNSDDDLHDGNDVVDNDDPKFVIELRLNEIVHEAQMLRRKIARIQHVVDNVLPDMECEISEVLKLAYNAKEVLDDLKIAD